MPKRVARVANFSIRSIVMRIQQLPQSNLKPNQPLPFPDVLWFKGFPCCHSRLYSMSRTALVQSHHYRITAFIDAHRHAIDTPSHQSRRSITPVSTQINDSFYPLAQNIPVLFTIKQNTRSHFDLVNRTDFSYYSSARSHERIQHRQRKDSRCSLVIEFI